MQYFELRWALSHTDPASLLFLIKDSLEFALINHINKAGSMSSYFQSNQQNSSLNQHSFPQVPISPSSPPLSSKLTKLLIHLKQNRVFYFIAAATVLVLIAILQIHSAYRNYEDNQRLVKLWIQEKELKDQMSHKSKETITHTRTRFAYNHSRQGVGLNHEPNRRPQHPTTSQKEMLEAQKNSKESVEKTFQSLEKLKPAAPDRHSLAQTTRSTEKVRPVAGITRAQANAALRWLKQKDEDFTNTTDLSQEERKYYEEKYQISKYDELPFCIVVPSYNNVKNGRHLKNIKSIIMQNYTNFHIVFIDDASTDGTGKEIQTFLKGQDKVPSQRYEIIINEKQMRAMSNLRRAAKEFCKPYEIFMIIDGDDEIIGRQVLKLFNSVFQKQQAWFVYSNFLSIRGNVGYSRPFPASIIKSNTYRKYPFVTSHLRAFYTQLFVNIKQEDLKDDKGEYLKAANDVAICIPILQQAHERVYYLKELTYYYNSNTGQNNHQLRLKQQKTNDKMLRKRATYAALKSFYPQK